MARATDSKTGLVVGSNPARSADNFFKQPVWRQKRPQLEKV